MRLSVSARRGLMVLIAISASSFVLPLFGDDKPGGKSGEKVPDIGPPTAEDLTDRRIVFIKTALARYTVEVVGQKESAKVSDPCLRWSNPVSGEKDGVLAVYTFNGGRPAAIAQFFQAGPKNWVNEFAIIAPSDVTIMHSGRPFWKPSEYICKFADVPDSPAPARQPPLRLAQMRKIAADFSVIDHFGWEDSSITNHNLRLLPQPVYRYSEEATILDGGLFVYAVGTDPECSLLLEAYQDAKGARYRYAFSPMSIYQLEARYKDTTVWEIERRKIFGASCRKYYALTYHPVPGETVPE